MVKIFILFIITYTQGGAFVATHEFDSIEQCSYVSASLLKRTASYGNQRIVDSFCYAK